MEGVRFPAFPHRRKMYEIKRIDVIKLVLFETIFQLERQNLKLKVTDPTILETKKLDLLSIVRLPHESQKKNYMLPLLQQIFLSAIPSEA